MKKNNIPALRFPQFNEPWVVKKLGEVCERIGSGKNKSKEETGLYPVYGSIGVIGYTDVYLFDSKLILVARVGANAGSLNLINEKCDISDNTLIIDINDSCVEFILDLLSYIDLNKLAFGSGQPLITATQLKLLPISLPTLPEQQKIADFLSGVDEKIGQLERRLALEEQYKKGMMQRLFDQEIRFKDDNGNEFPDWEEKKLGEVCEINLRKVEKPTKPYMRLGLRSHNKGTFHELVENPNSVMMDYLYQVKQNDLIVNITFAWEHAIAIASANDEGLLVSHRFPTYNILQNCIPVFLKYIISTKRFKQELVSISPGGAGRNRVMSKLKFPLIPISLPTLPEQQKIADFLSSLDDKIGQTKEELEKARVWKRGLMQRMFV